MISPSRSRDSHSPPDLSKTQVYADVDTDQSIVIEINKRSAVADEESVAYFWRDLMSVQDAEEPTVHKTGVYGPADVPGVDPAAVTVRLHLLAHVALVWLFFFLTFLAFLACVLP